jgi:DNA-binding transcriptional regulator LsrR (DeoR family)
LREAITTDTSVTEVMALWQKLTVSLVGIGSLAPSPLLQQSGNAITEEEQAELRILGAVGDVCLRFFDASGRHIHSRFDQRVVGASPEQLRQIPRRIGVAGGTEKHDAIRAALRGQWVNILITDLHTAQALIEGPA